MKVSNALFTAHCWGPMRRAEKSSDRASWSHSTQEASRRGTTRPHDASYLPYKPAGFRQKFIEAARPWRRGSCGRDALCVVHAVPSDALCAVHAVPRDALCAVPCRRSAPVLARHTVLVAAARREPPLAAVPEAGEPAAPLGRTRRSAPKRTR